MSNWNIVITQSKIFNHPKAGAYPYQNYIPNIPNSLRGPRIVRGPVSPTDSCLCPLNGDPRDTRPENCGNALGNCDTSGNCPCIRVEDPTPGPRPSPGPTPGPSPSPQTNCTVLANRVSAIVRNQCYNNPQCVAAVNFFNQSCPFT